MDGVSTRLGQLLRQLAFFFFSQRHIVDSSGLYNFVGRLSYTTFSDREAVRQVDDTSGPSGPSAFQGADVISRHFTD